MEDAADLEDAGDTKIDGTSEDAEDSKLGKGWVE